VLNEQQHQEAASNSYNFDHPDAFDFELLIDTMKRLKEHKNVQVPIYNFITHRRETKTTSMYGKWVESYDNMHSVLSWMLDKCTIQFAGANVIIFEGIFAFHNEVRKF
jgi:uridine kinase